MGDLLVPNKIHCLPVKVIYHLSSSSQLYASVLTGSHNVYVHQRRGSGHGESWGSMNLKAVARGICFASPEVVPTASNPDSSLYMLDPRETHSRRMGMNHASSSHAFSPSSAEVWTGKGMLSWACAEVGEGKTLVTGRLARFPCHEDDGLDALFGRDHGAMEWGLEVSLGVRSVDRSDEPENACTPLDGLFGRDVVLPGSRINVKREMSGTPVPDIKPFPRLALPKAHDKTTLTDAQAQRLLASPHLLDLLKKMSNPASVPEPNPVTVPSAGGKKKKRKTETQALLESQKQPEPHVCYNCGRTKSAVWRMKVDGGEQRRVCNACGLYWNKMKQMRPPELWEGVDEEVKRQEKEPGSGSAKAARSQQAASSSGFKRALTMAAENDAKRVRRSKAATATSPARASVSAASSAARRDSSPGGSWQLARRGNRLASKPIQSLDLPLSDDGQQAIPAQAGHWDESFSAFFNIEEFAPVRLESPPQTANSSPNDPTADFLRSVSSGARQKRQLADQQAALQLQSADDDDFSVLFRATSSAPASSSPPPFDFSSLPPSSPPIMPGHQTFGPSSPARPTPIAFTPDIDLYGQVIDPSPTETPAADMSSDELQSLLGMLANAPADGLGDENMFLTLLD